MFEAALLESSLDRVSVLTSRHRMPAMLAGLVGFLASWKLLPILFFTLNPMATLVYSLLFAAVVALHALMTCYVFAEARRLELGRFRWLVAALLTSLVGFIAFLIHSARRTGDWKRATVPLATLCEAVLLGILVLVPLIRTQALETDELQPDFDRKPLPPLPRVVAVFRERASAPPPHVKRSGPIIAPNFIPNTISMVPENPPSDVSNDVGVVGVGIPGGPRNGVIGVMLDAIARTVPPPPAPVQHKPKPIERYRVSQGVQAAKLIYAPKPEYPPLAKMARIQGKVRLEAVISADGRIQNLQALSGHPLLIQAALGAVAQWRYQPTLLSGEPVEVQTEIEVNFVLGE